MRISWNLCERTNLAGECIGELVRFFSLRMSCGFPPLPSHSTFMSSTFRFWWDDEQSSLKLNAEKRAKPVRPPRLKADEDPSRAAFTVGF